MSRICRAHRISTPRLLQNIAKVIRYGAPLLLVHLLSACAVEGDFGRIRPTPLSTTTDTILLNTDIITRGLQRNELTRDETILRETGNHLTRPIDFAPPLTDIPLRRPEHRGGSFYDRDMIAVPPDAIARSLDTDHQVLTRFGDAARRVIQSYGAQMERILKYDPVLRPQRREEARVRMQENIAYIDSVFAEFGRRLEAYHYAIGELRSHDVNPYGADLEGSLAHLRDRTAQLEYELKHYFGAVMARTQYHPSPVSMHGSRFGMRNLFGDRGGPVAEPDHMAQSYGKSFK